MALLIKTAGLEQYAPGGDAKLKLLIIGGPGVGKTRFASYFPKPIYANCEAGLASVADRRVPYVTVANSTDMKDLLAHLKVECRKPPEQRAYDTLVLDTLDALQRTLKAEWLERERKETFSGWEAWGWVAQNMANTMTRLLNLPMNVVVNAHYKDKTTRDDDTGRETHELMVQLQGEIADTVFNDFDLVGWMGTYFEAVGGERIQKRGLTFQPTPDKPWLKDRLAVTPKWLEVTFDGSDYDNLLSRVSDRVAELKPTETVGEIPSADPDADVPVTVARPEAVRSGPVPVTAEPALAQMDKPTLVAKARELGVTTLADGAPLKGNATKAELIDAIETYRESQVKAAAQEKLNQLKDRPTLPTQTNPTPPAAPVQRRPIEPPPQHLANPRRVRMPAPSAPPAQETASAPDIERVSEGLVNTRTGEILPDGTPTESTTESTTGSTTEPSRDEAVATVAQALGGQVVADTGPEQPAQPAQPSRQATASPAAEQLCEECRKDLSDENPDYVKLSYIKFRKRLCEGCYQEAKAKTGR